jgi:glycosyltransferase involved in cell wall biosynthesis
MLMERMLMPLGQLYLFESAYSCDLYLRKVGHPKATVAVVHNGIRRDELEPVECAGDAADIVFLGELRALKGVDVLIDAIARLHRENKRVTANLVGDGSERAELEAKCAQCGLTEWIRFCGPLPTRTAFALGRIVVLPSRAESFPYVVLEAAAAAKPLVATDVGGIPEIFGPYTQRLVPAGDPEALARRIVAMVDRPSQAADDARALQSRVAVHFSVDAMVEAVLASYMQARTGAVADFPLRNHARTRPGVLT